MVLDGALKMLAAQTSPAAKSMVEMNIIESRRRIEYLEGELKKLDLKKEGRNSTSTQQGSQPSAKGGKKFLFLISF